MVSSIKKHWSNIFFVLAIVLLLIPSSKEWLIKTVSLSPSLDSEQKVIENKHWDLKGLNTKNVNLSDFQGKVVFVNFWATWCPPCRAELPAIQNLYNAYKDKVVFLFVTNESYAVVDDFFEKYDYYLPVYNIISKTPIELNTTNSIPASYIINKNGKVVLSTTGAADWDSSKTYKMIDVLLQE